MSYDLEKGGTQEFITSDSEGYTIHIVVEELPGISLFSMNNGSYKISGSTKSDFGRQATMSVY
ncbi:DUF5626 family protein [Trichococcus flocculiformis]|uniref:DUF5626 family protein n=1 Tax=Trichococcus flocculiformis TaxID=82803 RepID=UPI00389AB695